MNLQLVLEYLCLDAIVILTICALDNDPVWFEIGDGVVVVQNAGPDA